MARLTSEPTDPEYVRATDEVVLLFNPSGQRVGYPEPLAEDVVAAVKRRLASTGPWLSTAEVADGLRLRGEA